MWQRRLDVDLLAGERMAKAKRARVQELPFQAEVPPYAVLGVPGHRQVDRGEVHADLMRTPGFEANFEKRVLAQKLRRSRSA